MTDTEMQIAIAEWYGEKSICVRCECEFHISLQTCPQCGCTYTGNRTTKDYLNDLNAMHEAEEKLSATGWTNYMGWLEVVCGPALQSSIHATALQRAEALLRTVNLWKE